MAAILEESFWKMSRMVNGGTVMQLQPKALKVIGYTVSVIFGSLLGSGALWQYLNWKMERTKTSIDLAAETAPLHEELNKTLIRIIELSRQLTYGQSLSNPLAEIGTSTTRVELDAQLQLAKSQFSILETRLAQLENRSPRQVNLDFIPPRPIPSVDLVDESGWSVTMALEEVPQEERSSVFFVHAGPEYYHRPGCSYLMNPIHKFSITASNSRYKACRFCVGKPEFLMKPKGGVQPPSAEFDKDSQTP